LAAGTATTAAQTSVQTTTAATVELFQYLDGHEGVRQINRERLFGSVGDENKSARRAFGNQLRFQSTLVQTVEQVYSLRRRIILWLQNNRSVLRSAGGVFRDSGGTHSHHSGSDHVTHHKPTEIPSG
jgi:hypothetical protein